jgi:hypothetical protein
MREAEAQELRLHCREVLSGKTKILTGRKQICGKYAEHSSANTVFTVSASPKDSKYLTNEYYPD